ncbi:unnamed protein product [Lathyrus sativus]|nr:unnamed protein product [Lathyrus sativus]
MHEQANIEKIEKYTWKIENFSCLNTDEVFSEPFVLGGYQWIIGLSPKGEDGSGDYLSIYLEVVETANMSKGWSRDVKFRLSLLNQLDNIIFAEEYSHGFKEGVESCGFESFITLDELHDPKKGFILKDACIVGAEVYVCKSTHVKLEEGQSQNAGKLMDFKGLGQVEIDFVPLLEQACSLHPSLIACQQERSPKFREWAFSALGRVLYFLKTKKVRDMDGIAGKELHILWAELEHFGFDLTWLEPHFQSALGMKSYLKKIERGRKDKG